MLSTSPLVSSCFRPCPLEGGQCVHLARGGSMIGPVGVTLVFVFRRAWPHLGEADVLYGVLYPGHFCGVYHRDMGHCMVYSLEMGTPERGACRAQPGPAHLHIPSFLSLSVFWITGARKRAHNSKKCDRRTGKPRLHRERSQSLCPHISPPLIYQVACWSADFTMRDQPINTGLTFYIGPNAFGLLSAEDPKREWWSLIVGRMGRGTFTPLKLWCFYLHLAEQYSPSFLDNFCRTHWHFQTFTVYGVA